MTIGEYLERWLINVEGTVAESTLETYALHVRHLIAAVGEMPMTPEELVRLLDAAKEYKYYLVIRLLALTGMRLGEVLGLRWQDVDLERGVLTVRQFG